MLDTYDCNGQNPYEIEEVLPGKIWRVGYSMENFMYTQPEPKQGMGIMGMNPTTDEFKQKGSVDLLSHFTKVKCDSWT